MTKPSTSKSRAPKLVRDVPLKSVLNAIIKDDKSRTLTTKQMRVVLRREYAVSMQHARNAAWTFTSTEADIVRARFDGKFRAKIEKATKRKPRAPKGIDTIEPVSTDA